ncbi:globin domain-containing protein [Thermostaphylospora chromogena]|uniref:nitric oxide dioxygenase n=1 Tax=Thermostaphylospora chromogena TaxID=35622 RepID=A0A1H0ZS95_9ACTN|nr:globin domain-containing protein [Thermostaphylospora chromogena]SDQ29886.1 nitric oxide dioxygenase [Thermostaphylospora chromogena]
MLSPESAEIVRATLPVVGASLDTITTRFYTSMFTERPDLLDGLFNRGNQANGEQRRALAGSIAGFAKALLDHPEERPDRLLSRIAHKHTAVGVTDDQYVIVHKYLFGAIADVLGEAATPDVIAAWDEVYWLMGGALIALEARIYAQVGADDGRTWRQWRVVERREETPDVVSFLLRPIGDDPVPPARPGQYVSVRVRMPDGVHQLRQYSLSGTGEEGLRRITVKRVRGGEGAPEGEVSTLLYDTVRPGDELTLSAPFGDVVLEDGDAPLVFASAGIGCTPITAMLEHLVATGSRRRVLLLHADTSPADHALRQDMERLADALPAAERIFWYEADAPQGARTGRMDLTGVQIPRNAVAYMCGPLPFMRDVRGRLRAAGVAARDIHYEVFGPDLWLGEDS